ncbi:MAG: acyltransferase [Chloroflexi bacterium]|nr:MAG: acyltransferase [Chloroflexota bacterium]
MTGVTPSRSLSRIAGLDGLRAIAVIAVILFHSHLPGTELGWAGVELFFVISGFLITRILLDLREHARYLQIFYARRALRILPLYYFVLIISVAMALSLGRSIGSLQVPFYLIYVQNYVPQISSSMSQGIPLTSHTWTLAVEEQFYWLWPLVILVVRGASLRYVLVGCMIAAPLARLALLLWTGNPFATVASLPAQVDALAAGAILAVAERAGTPATIFRRWGALAAIAGAIIIVVLVLSGGLSMFAHTEEWARRPLNVLLLSAFATLFVGVVALAASGRGRVIRALEWRPLAHVGRISYGIYIYNPLALFVASLLLTLSDSGYVEGDATQIAVGAVVTYVIAFLSWRYLETPILRLRESIAR